MKPNLNQASQCYFPTLLCSEVPLPHTYLHGPLEYTVSKHEKAIQWRNNAIKSFIPFFLFYLGTITGHHARSKTLASGR